MKIAYVGGSIFFGSMSAGFLWMISQAARGGQIWAALLLLFPFSLFLYATYLGIRLIQYMNLSITVGSDRLVVNKGNQRMEYPWQEIRIRTSGWWRVMHCYDLQGRRLFTVDYIFPGTKAIEGRIANRVPNN
jgi:hypothetical protein